MITDSPGPALLTGQCESVSRSVVSDSLHPMNPARLLYGILQATVLEWGPSPGDLPDLGIEPGSPA